MLTLHFRCDPYVLPGVLFTNSTEKAANRWEVIDPDLAPDGQGCPVGDYMSALSLSWEHESLGKLFKPLSSSYSTH